MAQLILKIRNAPSSVGPLDGDILRAMNNTAISRAQLERICHRRRAPRDSETGYLTGGGYMEEWYAQTCRIKYERINRSTVRRTDLVTSDQENLKSRLNASGRHMHVAEKIAILLRHPFPIVFGSVGAERWYEGPTTYDNLGPVWTKVTNETGQTLQRDVPMMASDLRKYLVIPVDDFDDSERSVLESPITQIIDGSVVVTSYRRHFVDIDTLSLSGVTREDLEDPRTAVDVRDAPELSRSLIVSERA